MSVEPRTTDSADLADLLPAVRRIRSAVQTVIEGKPEVIDLALTVLLAEGHLLIEDVPGVGKTHAGQDPGPRPRLLGAAHPVHPRPAARRTHRRLRLQPGHATTSSSGRVRCSRNIVLGDEINRASPKTQSALLECMEERQVTVDGQTFELASPFIVIATQNPVEMEGTYPLPEAQRDRFMARISMGYPDTAAELEMLVEHASHDPLDDLTPVADTAEMVKLVEAVRSVHVAPAIRQYAVDLAQATRTHDDLRLGASPRATLHLVRAAKAAAALDDRDHVLPDDLQRLASPVLTHRLLMSTDAQIAGRTAEQTVADIVRTVPVPAGPRDRPSA